MSQPSPLASVQTEALIEELKKRYHSMVLIGVLVDETTARVGGAHVCHWSGPAAQAIGLATLAQDFLRKQFALASPPTPPAVATSWVFP